MKVSVCSSNHSNRTSFSDPNPGSGAFMTSGSGIRDPGSAIRIRIQDEQPRSYFRELKKQFFGLKIHKIFYVDPGWKKLGSGMAKKVGYGIRDKHPDWQH